MQTIKPHFKYQILYTKGGPATWNNVCACEYVFARNQTEAWAKGKTLAVGQEQVATVQKVTNESYKP